MKSPILCATDFSSSAEEAARAALAVASRLGAALHVVHVVGPVSEFLGSISESRLLGTFIEIAEHRLTNLAKSLQTPSVQVTARVLEARGKASVASVLETLVADLKPKIVVIGTHKRGGGHFWGMGSFAETLAESLDAPVMVVHSARSLVEWGARQSTLRVYAGIDVTSDALPVLSMLKAFRSSENCSLIACYFEHSPLPVDGMQTLFVGGPQSLRTLEKHKVKLRQLLDRHVGPGVQTDVETAERSTGSHLIDLTLSEKPDLLILGTHHRGQLARLFLHSVSREVLRDSAVNILCVPLNRENPLVADEGKPQSKPTADASDPIPIHCGPQPAGNE